MERFHRALPHGIRRLLRLPADRDRIIRDDDEELRFHLEMWVADLRAQGMDEAEATAEARRRFGSLDEYRDHSRSRATRLDRWHRCTDWLSEWAQDVRFALRQFTKAPAFAAIAVLTLGLGIGANTAIFSVVHGLLITPLPYPDGDRIVALKTTGRSGFTSGLATTVPGMPQNPPRGVLRAWIDRGVSAFDEIGGMAYVGLALLANDRQDTVKYAFATANLLSVLGARPALGRSFLADEEQPGKNHVAMLSYAWWQTAYGGRADVLGKTIAYEGKPYVVVGVMPRDFILPDYQRLVDAYNPIFPAVWMPGPLRNMQATYGRLRAGVTVAAARRELQAIANSPEALAGTAGPRSVSDTVRVRVMRAQDFLSAREVRAVQVLFVAVGALLLIACANVANLLLVRAWVRRREFAVRMGLGAGRARLIRLALTESVLLALIAGIVGVFLAWQSLRLIIALRPVALDRLAGVQIDAPVLFWTAVISVLTGILFGGAAALFVSAQNVGDLLRNETRSASGGRTARRIRSMLVIGEIALSVTLLVAAGLLIRSFAALQETRIGFEPRNLVAIDVLGPTIDRSPAAPALRDAIAARLRAIPGALGAALGSMPTAGWTNRGTLEVESPDGNRRVSIPQFQKAWTSEGYFDAARIGFVSGRAPRRSVGDLAPGARMDVDNFSAEIVVSESLARRIAPDGNVLGRRLRTLAAPNPFLPPGLGAPGDPTWGTIVGVVSDVHFPGSSRDLDEYQIYQMPLMRIPGSMYIIRFAAIPPDVESVLRDAIHSVDPTLVARRATIGDDYLREALAPTRFTLALLGAFALIALVLSVVGLYGSIAYTVSQRTREIGIRIALGATPRAVTSLIVEDGVRLVITGLVIGAMTAAGSTRALTSLLYSVKATDLTTFVTIAVVVAIAALAASYLPARRAVRIDPVDALRAD